MPRTISVKAPSRLHFGMLCFGDPRGREFGGVGVMIDAPELALQISPSDHLEVTGPLSDRTLDFVNCVWDTWSLGGTLGCRIEIVSAPRAHVGLGVGTQLGLAIAAGLNAFLGRPELGPEELAQSVKRGARSSVGTHGFMQGGLIVESGKRHAREISPLVTRVEFPEAWRFVLVCPSDQNGLSGQDEEKAFRTLPPVPASTTDGLCREVLLHLIPAARQGCFDEFSESLFRYGRLAGDCFAKSQGGTYATPRVEQLVGSIRQMGVQGVSQSSWGPTVFAVLPDEQAATALVQQLHEQPTADRLEIVVTKANRTGARISDSQIAP